VSRYQSPSAIGARACLRGLAMLENSLLATLSDLGRRAAPLEGILQEFSADLDVYERRLKEKDI